MRATAAKHVSIIIIAVITGCTTSRAPSSSSVSTATPASYDGTYQGTIRLTSTSVGVSGGGSNWCNTPPGISLSVQNGAFTYVLMHPNVPKDATYSLSPTFAVTAGPDGSFDASSPNGEAEMIGRIVGSQMTGRINGTGCSYSFTAERS